MKKEISSQMVMLWPKAVLSHNQGITMSGVRNVDAFAFIAEQGKVG